jgi:transcriptional regulator with XRE-family HTH domain
MDVPVMDTLKTLRARYSLTQQELAAKVGVSHQRVSAWETGRGQPRLRHISSLAAALGVSSELILELFARQRAEPAGLQPSDTRPREQSRTNRERRLGPPRGDARVLAVLGNSWMSAAGVAARLQISEAAAYRALWRGQVRGLIEHRAGGGYKAKRPHP